MFVSRFLAGGLGISEECRFSRFKDCKVKKELGIFHYQMLCLCTCPGFGSGSIPGLLVNLKPGD